MTVRLFWLSWNGRRACQVVGHDLLFCGGVGTLVQTTDLIYTSEPSRPVSVRGGGALATLQFSVRRRFLARVRLNDDAVAARPSSHTFSVRR